jgi:hypothetical protein
MRILDLRTETNQRRTRTYGSAHPYCNKGNGFETHTSLPEIKQSERAGESTLSLVKSFFQLRQMHAGNKTVNTLNLNIIQGSALAYRGVQTRKIKKKNGSERSSSHSPPLY